MGAVKGLISQCKVEQIHTGPLEVGHASHITQQTGLHPIQPEGFFKPLAGLKLGYELSYLLNECKIMGLDLSSLLTDQNIRKTWLEVGNQNKQIQLYQEELSQKEDWLDQTFIRNFGEATLDFIHEADQNSEPADAVINENSKMDKISDTEEIFSNFEEDLNHILARPAEKSLIHLINICFAPAPYWNFQGIHNISTLGKGEIYKLTLIASWRW